MVQTSLVYLQHSSLSVVHVERKPQTANRWCALQLGIRKLKAYIPLQDRIQPCSYVYKHVVDESVVL